MTANVEFDGGIPVDIEFVEFMIASVFPDDAVNYTPQPGRTDAEKAVARNNIGAMAAGIQAEFAINSTDNDPNAAVHLETERRDSDATALSFYSGDFEAGAEHLTILGHLADGEQDSDAATVKQLNAFVSKLPPCISDEKFFEINVDGLVSLKPEYRGRGIDNYGYSVSDNGAGEQGSLNNELPEKIVIPDVIDGTAVSGFQIAVFYGNSRVMEITIPDAVNELPGRFCYNAYNLRAIHNADNVLKLGGFAFWCTRLEKAFFPNLQQISSGAFASACFLYAVDLGDKITAIPGSCFQNCISLSLVRGGGSVITIGNKAFMYTYNLKNLPLLTSNVTSIGNYAFHQSRIQFDWRSLTNCTFGTQAYPIQDNTADYWTGVDFTPCQNEIVTILSQTNAKWKDQAVAYAQWMRDGQPTTYYYCCDVFCVMHIYSALMGVQFSHPDEFMKVLSEIENRSLDWMLAENKPGYNNSRNIYLLFQDLGFKVTAYHNDDNSITIDEYKALCDALARGAYIYTQVATVADENSGHAVVIYGINSIGEMLILSPDNLCEDYRDTGDVVNCQLYRMPFSNMSGPLTNYVIVEKKE